MLFFKARHKILRRAVYNSVAFSDSLGRYRERQMSFAESGCAVEQKTRRIRTEIGGVILAEVEYFFHPAPRVDSRNCVCGIGIIIDIEALESRA